MRGAVLLFAVAVSGCGRYDFADLPDAAPVPARLIETHYEVGGVEFPDGIYDQTLATACQFSEINGSIRCVPKGMTVVFADPGCTQEIGARSECDTDVSYIVRGDINFAGDPTRIFRAGPSLGTVPMYIRNGDPDGCTEWSSLEGVTIGEEIGIEELAAGTVEIVPGSRLDTVTYVSGDGLRAPAHYVDRQLGFECGIGVAHTGFQCAPYQGIGYASYSTTSACADHVATATSVPAALQFHDIDGCALTDFTYYAVAGEITPSALFQTSSTCAAVVTLPAGPFYVSGAALPLQTFVETPDSIPGQRVVPTRLTGSPDVSPTYRLYDSQLDVHCYPQTMSDGSVRCVPEGAYTTDVYGDGACTNLVTYGAYLDFPNCVQEQFKYVIGGTRSACSTALDVYEIGPLFTGSFWVKDQMGGCTGPYAASGEPRYWELGRKLDPSELVEATLP